jgi:hypothetical protein
MTKRIDIMVDIETLGTGSNATIFQIAAMAFDINTGKVLSKFNKIADIGKNDTMNVDGSTIKWWLNTDKELLTNLLNQGEGSSEELLRCFAQWLGAEKFDFGNLYLWGNGILFDNKMLQEQMNALDGCHYPVEYKNDRDVRTIVDLAAAKFGITEKELKERYQDDSLKEHDAYDDVIYQISLVTECYKVLTR